MVSCCRRSADARRLRALSLIEVMVSQAIALVVISTMMTLVVAMVKKLNSEASVADAQVHLRQVTHLMLRDTQGIGGEGASGDLVFVTDGDTSGPDQLTIFRRDESVCGGALAVDVTGNGNGNGNGGGGTPGGNVVLAAIDDPTTAPTTAVCPINNFANCSSVELEGRTLTVAGAGKSLPMTAHNTTSTPGDCRVNFPGGQQETDAVAAYNTRYDPDVANINGILIAIQPNRVLVGSSFTYRLNGTTLQRSTGTGFEDILDNVFDLQVEQVFYDDDVTTNRGTLYLRGSTGTALPSGYEADEFIGLRIGIVTFASARADLVVPPPPEMSNRNLTTAPGDRRYRASFILATARNRGT